MRTLIFTCLAVFASTALAQTPGKPSRGPFPFRGTQLKIVTYQSGNSARQPDIYLLENDRVTVEFQCGRELVSPRKVRKTLNCSIRLTDRETQVSFLYGINDFYQKGTEAFFKDLAVGTVVDSFYMAGLGFPKSILMVVNGELRTYIPDSNEEGLFVEAQVAPVYDEKSSHR